jgi:outer membrane lipoprotein SlyB
MHHHFARLMIISALIFGGLACAAPRPILAPNGHLQEVGPDAAQRDIDECLRLAAEVDSESARSRQIAGHTAVGAATGAAAGSVAGAIAGNAGLGAAAGAAGGATGGLLRGLFRARDLEPAQRTYVEECLRQKGYQPLGWH